jgi:hypothetical protein
MSFANPAATARAGAARYVADLLGLLGDRDPLLVQEELLGAVSVATQGIPDEVLRRPEAPGKWSIIEVVKHLADSEIVYGYRIRMTLAMPNPDIQGYDQDLWARTLRYRETDLAEALAQLSLLRRINLKLVRSLGPDELARTGLHSERGPESVGRIIQLLAGHDLIHRRQIERIRRQVTA